MNFSQDSILNKIYKIKLKIDFKMKINDISKHIPMHNLYIENT